MALCCRQLAAQGLIAGRDGNLSVRLGADRVLVTPSGFIKSLLKPADMVEVDLAGKPRKRGTRKPTSELDLHLRILRHRPDVHAVVHAHPPVATGFAVAGEEIPGNLLPELIFVVGPVPLVPFGMPGPRVPRRFSGCWKSAASTRRGLRASRRRPTRHPSTSVRV